MTDFDARLPMIPDGFRAFATETQKRHMDAVNEHRGYRAASRLVEKYAAEAVKAASAKRETEGPEEEL